MKKIVARKGLPALVSLGVVALACAGTAIAQDRPLASSNADPLMAWSEQVWETARQGDSSRALGLFEQLPEVADPIVLEELKTAIARYQGNLDKREQTRSTRIEEVRTELQERLDASNLEDALISAIEWHELAHDKDTVLQDEQVRRLVQQAESKAREYESQGKWLDAHSLFNRLHGLYEQQDLYKDDLLRLSRRLMMLRLYTPELLHEMRNVQRLAQEEEPLPPYNDLGEAWQDKVSDISFDMVGQSVRLASLAFVDGASLGDLLIGGYEALRTMATTPDLAQAFPGLSNESSRERFVAYLDQMIERLAEAPERADTYDLISGLKNVMRTNERTVMIDENALLHEFGNGAMAELDDYSSIIWPDQIRQFERSTRGKFEGVGIQITLDDALRLQVVTPLPDTPAARAGIRSDDLIISIDGEPTLGISLQQAVDRITGEGGTKVTLGIQRGEDAEPFDVSLVRAEIPIHSVKGWDRNGRAETDWDWYVDPENDIGYVRLTQFSEETSLELNDALRQMRNTGLNGLILDLRYNPGGLLGEAVNVASLFVGPGEIVVTQEDARGAEQDRQLTRRRQLIGDIPVVVLINEGSASASEIVAGALQDYDRAVLVGSRSFGKGSVQNVYPLGGRQAALKLTTQYYRLPGGRLIHRTTGSQQWGVQPDVEVEMLPSQIGDALTLRMDADVVQFDENGQPMNETERPDPRALIDDGIDPQLETALLLVQSQVITEQAAVAVN